jgi:hypothetical protein
MNDDRNALVRDLSMPLASGSGWMKFLGIMFIISGILAAITIAGIIVAWLPIWIGVLLLQASSAIERANVGGEEADFRMALSKLRTYFVILGVLMLIYLAMIVLGIFNLTVLSSLLLHHGGRF